MEAGFAIHQRSGTRPAGGRHRNDDFSSGGYHQDGRRRRLDGRARRPPEATWRRELEGGRRRRHADDYQRQYQQPDADDGREGGRLDLRRRRVSFYAGDRARTVALSTSLPAESAL